MKLKEVVHEENLGHRISKEQFNFHSNRFELFDKDGETLNIIDMEKVENALELDVIETTEGSYEGWGVCFPVTHIKLDYKNKDNLSCLRLKFGGTDTTL